VSEAKNTDSSPFAMDPGMVSSLQGVRLVNYWGAAPVCPLSKRKRTFSFCTRPTEDLFLEPKQNQVYVAFVLERTYNFKISLGFRGGFDSQDFGLRHHPPYECLL
jgi:hypothetical protein